MVTDDGSDDDQSTVLISEFVGTHTKDIQMQSRPRMPNAHRHQRRQN